MSGFSDINVLMTTDTVGGVWTYSCTLASALAAAGAEVHLVTLGPRATADQRVMLYDRRVKLIETDLALEWQDPEGRDVANAGHVLSMLEAELEPEIVHLNSFREASFSWRAPTLVVAHSCVNSWALACQDMSWLSEEKWQRYTRAVADGLNKASAWVCPTRAFRDVIVDLYQPRSPGMVIANGIASRAPRGRKHSFIFAAGRIWDRAKNIAALADAACEVEWPVLVAGPGENAAPPGLTLLGSLSYDAVRARMHKAAIFASPALYEPFGLSVLEAAAARCALVLSDIPTFRELWRGAAVFVDPADRRSLSRALANLCTDHGRREELQRAAYERSLDYSLLRTTEAHLQLYQSLLKRDPIEPTRMEAHA